MSDPNRFDLVIFGATGFTGKYVLEEVARTAAKENIKWTVAGRSRVKLYMAIQEASKNTGIDLDGMNPLIADVTKLDSLIDMCLQTKLLLNCVGPYRFYGSVVVQTCIEVGCHYVDISGETEWLEKIYLHCNDQALKKELYIVQACGFDSIPAEFGVIFTKQKFRGQLDYIESYVEAIGGPDGITVNDGTWKSLVYSLHSKSSLRKLRTAIYTETTPIPNQKPPKRRAIFHSTVSDSYCVPFSGSDRAIVQRTNYLNYHHNNSKPIEYKPYFVVRGFFLMLHLFIIGCILFIFTRFSLGVKLLVKHPRVMSLGMFSSKGPSREQVKETTFEMTFVGEGSPRPLLQTSTSPASRRASRKSIQSLLTSRLSSSSVHLPTKIVTKIVGPEPGYITTPICMVQSAYVILNESQDMPNYGVLTPGRAFESTSLLKRLESCNISFKVLEN